MDRVLPLQSGTGHPCSVQVGSATGGGGGPEEKRCLFWEKEGSSQDTADQAACGEFRGKGSFLTKDPLALQAGPRSTNRLYGESGCRPCRSWEPSAGPLGNPEGPDADPDPGRAASLESWRHFQGAVPKGPGQGEMLKKDGSQASRTDSQGGKDEGHFRRRSAPPPPPLPEPWPICRKPEQKTLAPSQKEFDYHLESKVLPAQAPLAISWRVEQAHRSGAALETGCCPPPPLQVKRSFGPPKHGKPQQQKCPPPKCGCWLQTGEGQGEGSHQKLKLFHEQGLSRGLLMVRQQLFIPLRKTEVLRLDLRFHRWKDMGTNPGISQSQAPGPRVEGAASLDQRSTPRAASKPHPKASDVPQIMQLSQSFTEHLGCSRLSGDTGMRPSWYPHEGGSPVRENAEG
ncbi:hypothetical protein MJG53_019130 [Ovis ammon polii x Ovis aries]|uniref:Uncharacterized protein n=1 Tax=Ovis ammon polii x Ovis aries TaxID=2918886 RepID=A0ACB9U2I5_9CETA|nr:hypothetical protein MJG53_019130 [Ovis ammon polii x Ovis aries]